MQSSASFIILLTAFLPIRVLTETGSFDNEILPYMELVQCPSTIEPWGCLAKQSRKILDVWNGIVQKKWADLKVEADNTIASSAEARGYSISELMKEKPSVMLDKIANGARELSDFTKESINELLSVKDNSDEITNEIEENKENEARKKADQQLVAALINPSGLNGLASFGGHGGHKNKKKHGNKFPIKYGRSLGVTRGKKKKKAFVRMMLIAHIIKGKIDLLLKMFSAHLQIKFFIISLIGLAINIARFWIDIRRGVLPQKVIYYEHAHHQHHYDDHGDDGGWDGAAAGGYWKRSFDVVDGKENHHLVTSPDLAANTLRGIFPPDPHRIAYRRQLPAI